MSARIVGRQKLMDAVSVTRNTTAYSLSMPFDRCTGTVIVIFLSTAGVVTITQECSLNDVTWYAPVDANAAVLGTICTSRAGGTTVYYTSYSPVMAPYIRYRVTETNTATTVVTLTLMFQEER